MALGYHHGLDHLGLNVDQVSNVEATDADLPSITLEDELIVIRQVTLVDLIVLEIGIATEFFIQFGYPDVVVNRLTFRLHALVTSLPDHFKSFWLFNGDTSSV